MGTLLGQYVADGAWIKAQDTGHVRWTAAEGLRWLNNGQRCVVELKPTANSVSAVRPLQAGPRQTLAGLGLPRGIQVLDVPVNYAADLSTVGRAITLKERKHFDERKPLWRRDVASEAAHFMLDAAEPGTFYLWPAPLAGAVQVVHSSLPADVSDLTQAIAIGDQFANALEAFLLFSFYSKNSTFTAAPQRAAFEWQRFTSHLGVAANSEMANIARAMAASNAKGAQ